MRVPAGFTAVKQTLNERGGDDPDKTCPGGPVYFSHQALEHAGGMDPSPAKLSSGLYEAWYGLGSDDDPKMVRQQGALPPMG